MTKKTLTPLGAASRARLENEAYARSVRAEWARKIEAMVLLPVELHEDAPAQHEAREP